MPNPALLAPSQLLAYKIKPNTNFDLSMPASAVVLFIGTQPLNIGPVPIDEYDSVYLWAAVPLNSLPAIRHFTSMATGATILTPSIFIGSYTVSTPEGWRTQHVFEISPQVL